MRLPEPYLEPFPRAGILRSGSIYQPLRWEQDTKGGDGFLWPTPTTVLPDISCDRWLELRDHHAKTGQDKEFTLNMAVKFDAEERSRHEKISLWPTPNANNNHRHSNLELDKNGNRKAKNGGRSFSLSLEDSILVQMWPTPRASEWKGTGPLGSKSHIHRRDRGYLDATVQEAEQVTGRLNPDWVEVLMGVQAGYSRREGQPDPAMLHPESWLDGSWEEGISRLTDEKQDRAKRLRCLGNAVVPQCSFFVGRAVAQHLKNSCNSSSDL